MNTKIYMRCWHIYTRAIQIRRIRTYNVYLELPQYIVYENVT